MKRGFRLGLVILLGLLCRGVALGQALRKDIPTITREAVKASVLVVASNAKGRQTRQGSGFLITKDGSVVTNYHVVESAASAIIKFSNGSFYPIEGVLAADREKDIAILKATGTDFSFVPLGDSDALEVGEEVVAIGSPLALVATVSNGIVSAIREFKEEKIRLLQTTAPISPGSSGGALFNLMGEVVGITTFQFSSGQNLNFAIPINYVKPLLAANSLFPISALRSKNASLTGSYSGTVRNTTMNVSSEFSIAIRVEKGRVFGCMIVERPLYGSGRLEGTASGTTFAFDVNSPSFAISFRGKWDDDVLSGTYSVLRVDGVRQKGVFKLQKDSPEGPPSGFDPTTCLVDAIP